MLFTLTSVVFITLLFFSLSADKRYSLHESTTAASQRIRSVNHFIGEIEQDIQRGTYIATFRALLGIQQYITANGQFLNDTQATFGEILVNGTIDGAYISVMNSTELNVWIAKIQQEAAKVAIRLDYRINDVEIYHESPWIASVALNVTLNISDIRGTASWLRDQIIVSQINITTFEDPLYAVYTYGRIINTVLQTNITEFAVGNDTTGLLYHLDRSLYINSTGGPSYVMRLSGNLSGSPYGIESLVNLRRFEDMLLEVKERSCVDYVYFSNESVTSYLINNTYNWFRLDNASDHLRIYQVEHLADI